MKAVYLKKTSELPLVREVPEPTLRSGAVIVEVESAPVLSFMKQVVSGQLGYFMPVPFIPGAGGIGKIVSVANDVYDLRPGQLVYLDPAMGSSVNNGQFDGVLIGLTGLSAVSGRTFELWHDGTFAQRALVPAETLTVLDDISELGAEKLTALTRLAIPYGGLLKSGLRAGGTIAIGGATGNMGAAAVLVALAMGAAKVVALSREERILQELQALDSKRIITVALTGESAQKTAGLIKEAGGDIDVFFDMTGGTRSPEPVMAGLAALRRGGTAVFMGGVEATLPLPYQQIMLNEITIRGVFMYERTAPRDLANMVKGGTLNLDAFTITSFSLQDFEKAFDFAAQSKGLRLTILKPNQ